MKDSKAVKLIALAYDEGQHDGYDKGYREASENFDERAEEAYEQGRLSGLEQAKCCKTGPAQAEALAQAKSRAYEEGYAKAQEEAHKVGYQRGLAEGQARGSGSENSYNSGLEAGVKAERERALAAEPKLQVWFKPCGPSPKPPETYPPGLDKIDAIKAIREAYGSGEGYGLKEVKVLVETVSFGARFVCGKALPQSKAVTLYLALSAAGFDPVLKA